MYSRGELDAWEEQQRRRKADGAATKDKGKGRETAKPVGDDAGRGKEGRTADQPMDLDESRVQDGAEPASEASARGDQVLRELLGGANQ